MDTTLLKRQAAERAVMCVQSGMVVGLGHGSTALEAIRLIANSLHAGQLRDIRGIACSSKVEEDAHLLGIPLTTLEEHPVIDITIDGADELTLDFHIIKGGGGALLREKIVAQASRREIIITDETKLSTTLGIHSLVPVEVIPFGWRTQATYLQDIGASWTMRAGEAGAPFLTDQLNYILDCDFGPIHQPERLAECLQARAGIATHGLFLNLATDIIIAGPGGVREYRKSG